MPTMVKTNPILFEGPLVPKLQLDTTKQELGSETILFIAKVSKSYKPLKS